jgi:hypothetical protein
MKNDNRSRLGPNPSSVAHVTSLRYLTYASARLADLPRAPLSDFWAHASTTTPHSDLGFPLCLVGPRRQLDLPLPRAYGGTTATAAALSLEIGQLAPTTPGPLGHPSTFISSWDPSAPIPPDPPLEKPHAVYPSPTEREERAPS